MNKVTRMLAMVGMSLAATAMIGAGAASAASAAPASPSADKSASTATKAQFPGKSKVVGYYRNAFTCDKVGNAGEWRHRWDDHECYRVRSNFHRGSWVLVAKWDNHFGNFGNHDNFNDHDNNFNGHDNNFNDHDNPWDKKDR